MAAAATSSPNRFEGNATASLIRLFQMRLWRLMALIAMAAVVFAAWWFNRDYGSASKRRLAGRFSN